VKIEGGVPLPGSYPVAAVLLFPLFFHLSCSRTETNPAFGLLDEIEQIENVWRAGLRPQFGNCLFEIDPLTKEPHEGPPEGVDTFSIKPYPSQTHDVDPSHCVSTVHDAKWRYIAAGTREPA